MSLREWLIVAGAVIVVGLLIDSVRRIHRARRDSLEVSREMGAQDLDASPIDENYNPELPNGGARTVNRDDTGAGGGARRRPLTGNPPVKPTRRIIDGQEVPIVEAVEEDNTATETVDERFESFSATGDESLEFAEPFSAVDASGDDGVEPASEEAIPEVNDRAPDPVEMASRPAEQQAWTESVTEPAVPEGNMADQDADDAGTESRAQKPVAGANRPVAEEVVVINVHSRSETGFRGSELRKLFEGCGMEFGDMSIYHRHEEPDTVSPVQFSVASAVKPGTFEPDDMDCQHYTGISFFMSLPGPSEPLKAFDYMLETAQCVVSNLGGELKDERQSVMTAQTTEHCRQRIREFERKRRSVRA